MTAWVVAKRGDAGMSGEDLLHACALHPEAAAVDEAHLAQAPEPCLLEIGIDDIGNVAWREWMEIELGADRYDVGVFHGAWNAKGAR